MHLAGRNRGCICTRRLQSNYDSVCRQSCAFDAYYTFPYNFAQSAETAGHVLSLWFRDLTRYRYPMMFRDVLLRLTVDHWIHKCVRKNPLLSTVVDVILQTVVFLYPRHHNEFPQDGCSNTL